MVWSRNQWAHDAAFRCLEGIGLPQDVANTIMERIVQELLTVNNEASRPRWMGETREAP